MEGEKSFILCVPTYAWRIPKIVSDFLMKTQLIGSDKVYFVMTCGGEIGKAEKYNRELCEKIGKEYMGTAQIRMAENYIAMFDATDEEKEEALMKEADKKLEALAQAIGRGEKLPIVKTPFAAGFLSGAVNRLFYPLFVKDKKFFVKDSCVSCGVCKEKCPLSNIELKSGKPVWLGNCTHCMACISYCPVKAIEYGKKSKGQRRYLCRKFEG